MATRRQLKERVQREKEQRPLVNQQNEKFARSAREAMESKPDPGTAIRPMTIDDAPFIVDSWATSFTHSSRLDNVPPDVYKVEQRSRIDRLVQRSAVLCIHPIPDPPHLFGYIVFEPPRKATDLPILHYMLIHPSLQGQGLGAQLVDLVRTTAKDPSDPIWITHWTIPMRKLIPRWNLIFNPYLLEIPHVS